MTRPLRIEYNNAWYHVMNRGRRGEPVFESKEDYEEFISILHEASGLFGLRISAYCLMANHYHLLVQTPHANLSRCMRHINGVYTQRYNSRHSVDGQLFRGRYKAIPVSEDSYLLQLVRYIHRNPVRAGLVEKESDYKWSSHNGYLSRSKQWEWLNKGFILSMLSAEPSLMIKSYRKFMGEEEDDSLLRLLRLKKLPTILGAQSFIADLKSRFFELKRHAEIPESRSLAPDMEQIIKEICRFYDIKKDDLTLSKRGYFNEPRAVGLYLARQLRGETLKNIGDQFEIDNYSTVSTVIERFKVRLRSDRTLSRRVGQIRKVLMSQGQT